MAEIPSWHLAGDWFDVCKCSIPCPCTFAQAPTEATAMGSWCGTSTRAASATPAWDLGLELRRRPRSSVDIWDEDMKANTVPSSLHPARGRARAGGDAGDLQRSGGRLAGDLRQQAAIHARTGAV